MDKTITHLDDATQDRVKTEARRWRNAVRRGDYSAAFAAQEIAGKVTYPGEPSVARWREIVKLAKKHCK